MHIEEIHIQNFKLFEQRSYKLHPQFNLVVGVNGSGKTSLLKAIAQVLAECMQGVNQELPFEDDDVRLVPASPGSQFVRFEKIFPVEITANVAGFGFKANQEIKFNQYIEKTKFPTKAIGFTFANNEWAYLIRQQANKRDQGESVSLPVIAFYRCNRLWKNNGTMPTPFDAATKKESRLAGYDSWFDASTDFPSFWRWVISKTLERLEALAEKDNYFSIASPIESDELDLVNKAVANCLENAKSIRYDLKQKSILVTWNNTGKFTPFELLSDGQRILMAMVADIARRACLLNPHLAGEVLEETPGIVLIDELDLHLHPKWQRRIIGDLRSTFPKIQFIATTHSPQLIGQVKPDEVLLLSDEETKHPGQSYGMDSNWILKHVMDSPIRDPIIDDRLDRVFESIEEGQFDEAEKSIAEMRAETGEHPDLVEAEVLISQYTRFSEEGKE